MPALLGVTTVADEMASTREQKLYDEWVLTRERLSTHIERLQLLLAARRAGKGAEATREALETLRGWQSEVDARALDLLMPK